MLVNFLIGLREGLQAVLVVGSVIWANVAGGGESGVKIVASDSKQIATDSTQIRKLSDQVNALAEPLSKLTAVILK